MAYIGLRSELRWFAELMELRLRANVWKGGWHNDGRALLYGMLRRRRMNWNMPYFPSGKKKRRESSRELRTLRTSP